MTTDAKWALILGASSGTGAAAARAVARSAGLNVCGYHRGNHPRSAQEVARDVHEAGRRAELVEGDASTPEAATAGAERLRRSAGPHSVKLFVHAIAAASVGRFLPIGDDALHPRQIERTFERMAHSFVYWARALHEAELLAPRALLLGLTNPLHESLMDNCGLIAATKGALEQYVRALALELGPLGHRVNLLKFGTVKTPALERVYGEEAFARVERNHAKMNPAGRMCTLEEVGAFIASLTRPEAEWFNGATIDYTGGISLRLLELAVRGGLSQ